MQRAKIKFVQSCAQKRDHRNCQQQTGKSQEDIEYVTGDDSIDPAAVITSECAENCSHNSRDRNHDDTDFERNAGAKNDPRENVPPGRVGSKAIFALKAEDSAERG